MNYCRQVISRIGHMKPVVTYYYQPARNAGHSKWANIKHVKASKDQERASLTLRYVNLIKVAVREGGGIADPKSNSKLAQVLSAIKDAKLPFSSFERTLQREQAKKDEKRQTLVMRGPGNCILVTEISSATLMKTRNEINGILKKNKAIIAEDSLLKLFDHKGIINSSDLDGKPANSESLDGVVADAIEAGADDVKFQPDHPDFGNVYEFHTSPESFFRVKHALEKLKYTIVSGEVEYIPEKPLELDELTMNEVLKLYEKLMDHQDVVKVATNIA